MAHCHPEETRAYARLPGLDIAVLHRGAHGGSGEQVMIALRAVPSFAALGHPAWGAADPLVLWMRLGQAMWASWLGCLAAATTPPWIGRGD
jgi:hypothetical protein